MQNQDDGQRYTDPNHPGHGGSNARSQYPRGKDADSGKPFQFPWWTIVIMFCVGLWPVGIAFIVMNSLMKEGKLSGFEAMAREKIAQFQRTSRTTTTPDGRTVYEAEFRHVDENEPAAQQAAQTPIYDQAAPPQGKTAGKKVKGAGLATGLTVAGILLLIAALAALPEGIYWLPDALAEGGYYWRWLLQDSMPTLLGVVGGIGCLFGAHKLRTGNRLRKKIVNIVGDAPYMYIEDIASAIPCSYEKCCKHLENCIDAGIFGPEAYLDMNRRCLVVKGKAPEKTAAQAPVNPQASTAASAKETEQTKDQYQKILDELRRVNDAIPDAEMTDKISRLEAVSAKIFEQAKADPDKLPRMRKFMDYYLPTSLKLLQAYAELDAQGVEGENITESKRRIEQTMDTLVHAFETQLDQLFAADAMDISADIDVMQNMMRADGLTDDTPFQTK